MNLLGAFTGPQAATEIASVDRRLDRPVPHLKRLDSLWTTVESRAQTTGEMNRDAATALYNLVRGLDAETVIETGVAAGASTAHLLQACHDQGRGHVTSIDLPFFDGDDIDSFRERTHQEFGGAAVPAAVGPGYAMPDTLRQSDRWTLREGRSQRLLPEVIVEHDSIDLFIHDSEHSLPAMLAEMEIAWPRLREGGVLVVDDLSWTEAWDRWLDQRDATVREHGRLAEDVGYAVRGAGG